MYTLNADLNVAADDILEVSWAFTSWRLLWDPLLIDTVHEREFTTRSIEFDQITDPVLAGVYWLLC